MRVEQHGQVGDGSLGGRPARLPGFGEQPFDAAVMGENLLGKGFVDRQFLNLRAGFCALFVGGSRRKRRGNTVEKRHGEPFRDSRGVCVVWTTLGTGNPVATACVPIRR